ncbi:MAG TPA: protein kinase [Planctomycetota bacterium]|nr:protein kinase [Planctomycetota bacterium]
MAASDLVGSTFDGWRITALLGQGGMGAVLRATNVRTGQEGAFKVIVAGKTGPKPAARLKREVELLSRLSHPGVVKVLDAGSLPTGRPYYVMELVAGRGLDAILNDEAPLPPRRAALLVARAARALGHAHAQAIIHRDVKPTNIIVREGDEPVVLDFGLAKAVFEDEAERLSVTGQLLGTVAYMSPEQAGTGKEVGPPSDVFSLGIILYELLTGVAPFEGDSAMNVLAKIQTDDPPPLRAHVEGVPAPLEAVCLKALAKSAALRYRDGDAFALDLERFLEGRRTEAKIRSPGRGKATAALVALVALVALSVGLVRGRAPDPVVAEEARKTAHAYAVQAAQQLRKGTLEAAAAEVAHGHAQGATDVPLLDAAEGLVLDGQGRTAEAAPLLERARASATPEIDELFPDHRVDEALARALVAAGRPADAVKALDRALARGVDARSTGGARLKLLRAKARLAAHDEAGALPDYEAARLVLAAQDPRAAMEPELAHAYAARAWSRLATDKTGAVRDLRAAAELDRSVFQGDDARKAAEVLETAARSALDGMAGSIDDPRRAAADRVREVHALYDLAVLLDPTRVATATDFLEKEAPLATPPDANDGVRFLVAARYRKLSVPLANPEVILGNMAEAVASLRAELDRAGKDPVKISSAYQTFSHVHRRQWPDAAFEAEEELRALCPPELLPRWKFIRGLTLGVMNRTEDAHRLLEEAVMDSAPLAPREHLEALFWCGAFENDSKRFPEDAVRHLSELVAIQDREQLPYENGWPFLHLGESLMQLGKIEEANQALMRGYQYGKFDDKRGGDLRTRINLGRDKLRGH